MAYYPAGSREDDLINEKIKTFGVSLKQKSKTKTRQTDKEPEDDQEEAEEQDRDVDEQDEPEQLNNQSKKTFMGFLKTKNRQQRIEEQKKMFNPKSRRFKKFLGLVFLFGLIVGGIIFYKASSFAGKISTNGSLFTGWFGDLKSNEQGQINILVFGMRGKNIPGGSLLADSIMVVAVRPEENKAALISIPRDLYVEIPGKDYSRKINEANPIGEEQGEGKGLELMKKTVSNVTGLDIHYAVSTNFNALREIVDVLGGITIYLDKPFVEDEQYVEGQECGGKFILPAGEVHLDGEEALCYSRARFKTSDFDRARRQQEVLLAIKEKALALGTLSNFSKVNNIIDVVGTNIKTDMKTGEMKKMFELFKNMDNMKIYKKVLDNSKNGLLYSSNNGSYILLPKGDNFEQIHQACQNIFKQEDKQESESGDQDEAKNQNDDSTNSNND
ncbi:MAG: hypothetical protein GF332_00945 [Candidatus Moranbacteria bacterium]|nr:hypothetical protein [Candidatus Moranbacteria bacterium]